MATAEELVLLVSGGQRPEMLSNTPQSTRQLPTAKNDLGPKVNSTEVEKH